MEQFRKFVDVYNQKLAAMKGGEKSVDNDLDVEEIGNTPRQDPTGGYGGSRKASHNTANLSMRELE